MGSGSGSPLEPPGRRRTDEDYEASSKAFGFRAQSPDLIRGPTLKSQARSNWSYLDLMRCHGLGWSPMDTDNESNQADRTISTGKLHALLHFHTRPINVVVFHGSQGNARFEVGFPLRCLQRLSRPYIATLHCRWRDNSSTRGTFIPVLSY